MNVVVESGVFVNLGSVYLKLRKSGADGQGLRLADNIPTTRSETLHKRSRAIYGVC